jgi:large subunit ribosomal protein L35
MPKMKTHKGAQKRFKVTGSGLVVHFPTNKHHKNIHKGRARLRRLKRSTMLSNAFQKNIRELLPH